MSKKKFKETKIGSWLTKKAPKILDVVDDFVPPVKVLTKLIENEPDLSHEDKIEAQTLIQSYEKELYEIEVKDRDSARIREVEVAKTGKNDWMMYVTGLVGLLAFGTIVYAVIWVPSVVENKLFIHLMGMTEGVVISNLFAYYFGTSKNEVKR